jgi:hypothetical protein
VRASPYATVHVPVAESRASARYVAHRTAREWFVGGPGFTGDDDSRFTRLSVDEMWELLEDISSDLKDLRVGHYAFRPAEGAPWQRGRIPRGQTFFVAYDVRPKGPTIAPGVAGAYANCWVVCASLEIAKKRAAEQLERAGWAIVGALGSREVGDDVAEGTEVYVRQTRIDGFVVVMHTYPVDDPDVD